MISQLLAQYEAVTATAGVPASAGDITVVFDAGQNSGDNFAHLAGTGLHYIGSVPAPDCPGLTALPASARTVVDEDQFGGLTAFDTRRQAYGAQRRAILTHSPELRQSQAAGFEGTTLAKAGKKLDELAATLARGRARRPASRSRPRSPRSPASPGSAASSSGASTVTGPGTCAFPGLRTRKPVPPSKRRSSGSMC
jgi:hypothetical protein